MASYAISCGDGSSSHQSDKSVGQHDKHKKQKAWTYPEYYSEWQCRKQECKPKFHPGKSFRYNGVYFSRQYCPPLTNWLEVFNAPPGDQGVIIEEAEE